MQNLETDTSYRRARLVTLDEVRGLELWTNNYPELAKDHRYYEVVDETLRADFEFHYLLLEDAESRPCAIQPVFFVDQDLLATAPKLLRALAASVRTLFPRFLRLRMLMAGCAAGEGHPGGLEADWRRNVTACAEALPELARHNGARLIIWKDWPVEYRQAFDTSRFMRVASMPATRLALTFRGFEDYMQRQLSHSMRKNLRRKFRATSQSPLVMTVVNSVAGFVDDVHALYEQVLARSPLQFERLTKDFLLRLGESMPDRIRFFLWRQEGQLVACNICLVHNGVIYDEYLGLDYAVALEKSLYFVTIRDVLTWAMEQGIEHYRSTPLNYDPKLHMGFELAPLDLYVAGGAPLWHALIRALLPWIEPTRSEPALAKFPNAHQMGLSEIASAAERDFPADAPDNSPPLPQPALGLTAECAKAQSTAERE